MIVSPKPHLVALIGARAKQKEDVLSGIPIKIKSVYFEKAMLVVNGGQEVISFNSSSDPEGTKAYKIINALWEGRYEMRGNEISNRNYATMSMGNLKRVSGVPTKAALDKQVNRLNARFSEKNLAIRIDKTGGQYKLVIKFG